MKLSFPDSIRQFLSGDTWVQGSKYSAVLPPIDINLETLLENHSFLQGTQSSSSSLAPSRSVSPNPASPPPSSLPPCSTPGPTLPGPSCADPIPGQLNDDNPKKRKRRRTKEGHREKSHAARRRRRQEEGSIAYSRDLDTLMHYRANPAKFDYVEVDPAVVEIDKLDPAATGYVGKTGSLPETREYALSELVGEGSMDFRLVRFDSTITRPILGSDGNKVMAIVVPGPADYESWDDNTNAIGKTLERLAPMVFGEEDDTTASQNPGEKGKQPAGEIRGGNTNGESQTTLKTPEHSRRGLFHSLSCGVSYGNGQSRPKCINQTKARERVLDEIRNDAAVRRLVGFINVVFLTWAPLLFIYYAETLSALMLKYPDLTFPFLNSVFAAFTVNFGPSTVCFPHRDVKNLAFGWCSITALGNYDWSKGGHLVLWDLKLVIEFPPGCTVMLPSALICHSNTSIGQGETRYSFAMYSAGGLFRWVEHGFMLEKIYETGLEQAKRRLEGARRWATGLDFFSSLEDLRRGVFSEYDR